MRRGTTPTHTFRLPFKIPDGSSVRVVYAQNGVNVLERTTESCEVEGNVITLKLTAEETLLFDCSDHELNGRFEPYPLEIQVGVRTAAGDQLWSDIIVDTVERCLKEDGVI